MLILPALRSRSLFAVRDKDERAAFDSNELLRFANDAAAVPDEENVAVADDVGRNGFCCC